MINRIVLVGRLTRDPELRKTNTGTVCSFTVAVDNRQKNPDGTKSTTFVPCIAFNQSADNTVKYTRKGSLVGVEGRLNQRSYNRTNDGAKVTVYEVVCDSVQFLEPKNSANAQPAAEDNISFDDSVGTSENIDSLDMPDDDLPF